MNRQKVYCIPGFGVDDKIFSNLNIDAELQIINWIEPINTETIQEYAKRLAEKIEEPNPVLIGVSFGGMIAIEMGKIIPIAQIILISSVKCRSELPFWFRWAGTLKLNTIVPIKQMLQSNKVFILIHWLLGIVTPEEKVFATNFRLKSSINYIAWSFDKIFKWKNTAYPSSIVHLHGNKDKMLPVMCVHPTHIINGGTHMMIFNKSVEISGIINSILSTERPAKAIPNYP